MTSAQVREYLESRSLILVPLGSTEQHGLLAPLSCDSAVVREICLRAAEAAGVICAPALQYGFSECHTGFPGTVSLSRRTLASIIEDIVRSLAPHGFGAFLFLSGHGGNRSAALTAMDGLRALYPRLRLEYKGYWNLPGAAVEEARLFDGRSGFHATAAEVSIYTHLFPDFQPPPGAIRQYPPSPAEGATLTADDWMKIYPDGPAGVDARQISPEKGAELLDFLCGSLAGVLSEMAGGRDY